MENCKAKKQPRKKINSRAKGARGEREFANFLKEEFGIKARRGVQFQGGTDSPDVVTEIKDIHFEVKRVEALNLYKAFEQAERDAGDKIPVVAHRRSNQKWVLCFYAKDLIGFNNAFNDVKKADSKPQ